MTAKSNKEKCNRKATTMTKEASKVKQRTRCIFFAGLSLIASGCIDLYSLHFHGLLGFIAGMWLLVEPSGATVVGLAASSWRLMTILLHDFGVVDSWIFSEGFNILDGLTDTYHYLGWTMISLLCFVFVLCGTAALFFPKPPKQKGSSLPLEIASPQQPLSPRQQPHVQLYPATIANPVTGGFQQILVVGEMPPANAPMGTLHPAGYVFMAQPQNLQPHPYYQPINPEVHPPIPAAVNIPPNPKPSPPSPPIQP